MPKFAANLSMMFQDLGFLDRFDAAARAGFKGVEFLFPYDHPPQAIAERLEQNRLSLALFNTVPGDWAGGERGLAAVPGREREFRDGVDLAIRYATATQCPLLHTMATADGNAAVRRLAILCLKNGSPQRESIVLLEGLAQDDEADAELRRAAASVAQQLKRRAPKQTKH